MPPEPSAIPVGTQFSPTLIDLGEFIRALCTNSGDRAALRAAIWKPPVNIRKKNPNPTKRLINLPLEAAVQYGLLQKGSYEVTELARALAKLHGQSLHEAFGRHVLLDCGGLRVVGAIQEMQADGRLVTGDSLAQYLTAGGFPVTEHNTAINSLRMWLALAGIVSHAGWKVDEDAKERVLGLDDDALGILASLTPDQRAFAEALCQIDPKGEALAADVRTQAEVTSGQRLGRSSLPKDYLEPLAQAGLITYTSGGTSGGKSARLRTTPKFDKEVLEPFFARTISTLDADVSAYYRRRPADIFNDLKSDDRFTKGHALEAFAVYLMRLLGLRFLYWRKRGTETAGAEIDVVLAGLFGGTPTRWQVQCKNTPSQSTALEDVPKEVGLLPITNATHILFIANGRYTEDARRYADAIRARLAVTIYLLDKDDFEALKADTSALSKILLRQAQAMLRRGTPDSLWDSAPMRSQ